MIFDRYNILNFLPIFLDEKLLTMVSIPISSNNFFFIAPFLFSQFIHLSFFFCCFSLNKNDVKDMQKIEKEYLTSELIFLPIIKIEDDSILTIIV